MLNKKTKQQQTNQPPPPKKKPDYKIAHGYNWVKKKINLHKNQVHSWANRVQVGINLPKYASLIFIILLLVTIYF